MVKAALINKKIVIKFILICLLFLSYFSYLSYQYNIITGGVASILTWSFFVLCTPIADAGFLLDFPLRVILGIRMIISEIAVWVIAISINTFAVVYMPSCYEYTALTKILYKIIFTPYPYWGIILLSVIGTFLSIKFGDDVMDAVGSKSRGIFNFDNLKYKLVMLSFFIIIILAYYDLVKSLGISSFIK